MSEFDMTRPLVPEELELLRAKTRSAVLEGDIKEIELRHRQRFEADKLAEQDQKRIFHFFAQVSKGTVSETIETLGHWARRDPGEDITIVFNSPGGNVFEGFALFDFIQDLRGRGHRITTKSLGMAASMGGILLQAGDERVMSPHGYMLIHEISGGAGGTASDIEDTLKLIERLQKKSLGILAERSSMTAQQIARKWKKNDWWLDADEALALGFIDRIEA